MKNDLPLIDYSTKSKRESTVQLLWSLAKNARQVQDDRWVRQKKIYDNARLALDADDIDDAEKSILTEPYIQVESQIDPMVPEPEFRGRDADMDDQKAKQREYVCKYIMQRNDIESKNTIAERYLRKHGDSVWKVYWDPNVKNPNGKDGEVMLAPVAIDNLYPDPDCKDLQEGEYCQYVYYKHFMELRRRYGKKLDDIVLSATAHPTETESISRNESSDATFLRQVVEHWYKDDEGRIACSVQINGEEIEHIKDYWEKTGEQNRLFPFVHMWCIRELDEFWNISEIDVMSPLLRVADKTLGLGLKNMEYNSNDQIGVEEGALAEGQEPTNEPGAVLTFNPGKLSNNSWRRLGGLNNMPNFLPIVQAIQNEIQRTTRNFDSNQGKETQRVTTASGLAQLRADAQAQSSIKNTDRLNGFKRLFELIDWTALEFYDTDRYIYIGAEGGKRKQGGLETNLDPLNGDIYFKYNSDEMRNAVHVDDGEPEYYYPRIDVTVNAGDGIIKSKSFTAQVLEQLLAVQLTPDNYRIALALIDILDIPQKQELSEMWRQKFAALEAQQQAMLAQQARLSQSAEMSPDEQAIIASLPPELQRAAQGRPDMLKAALLQANAGNPV